MKPFLIFCLFLVTIACFGQTDPAVCIDSMIIGTNETRFAEKPRPTAKGNLSFKRSGDWRLPCDIQVTPDLRIPCELIAVPLEPEEIAAQVSTDTIKYLGTSGRICKIFGHNWRSGAPSDVIQGTIVFTNATYHPDTSYRTCKVCGLYQTQDHSWK